MTQDEVQQVAKAAATEAVNDVFLRLGYDLEGDEGAKEIKEIGKDLRHLRRWRNATETVGKQSIGAMVTLLVGGIVAAIWLAVTGGNKP